MDGVKSNEGRGRNTKKKKSKKEGGSPEMAGCRKSKKSDKRKG